MAFMVHGIGTLVYGERDYWPDGSFVTTEWFVVAWAPIFPIVGKRISYARNSDYATFDPSGYYVYETLPLVRKQVLYTCGWFASVIAPFVVWGTYRNALAKKLGDEDRAAGLCLLTAAIIFVLPYFLRRWAKRWKAQEWNVRVSDYKDERRVTISSCQPGGQNTRQAGEVGPNFEIVPASREHVSDAFEGIVAEFH